jgi:hypothetical protein
MLFQSFFALFSLFICALATVPAIVYRGDSRTPAQIKAAGGFETYAGTNNKEPNHDLILHCEGGHEDDDGFVSTSKSHEVATRFAKKKAGYMYYIDTTKNPSQYIDVKKWCKDNDKRNPLPREQEFASKGGIPWSNIIKWDKVAKGGSVESTETRADFDKGGSRSGSPKPKSKTPPQIRGTTPQKKPTKPKNAPKQKLPPPQIQNVDRE